MFLSVLPFNRWREICLLVNVGRGMETEKEKREPMYYRMSKHLLQKKKKKSPVLIDLLFAGMPLAPYCSNLIMLLTDVADTVSPFWIQIV